MKSKYTNGIHKSIKENELLQRCQHLQGWFWVMTLQSLVHCVTNSEDGNLNHHQYKISDPIFVTSLKKKILDTEQPNLPTTA